mgnify:CR=1 FL=1
MNPPCFRDYNNREIQENLAGMSFDDGMWRLNAKLDSLMHFVEQYRNVNVLNSNYMICVLCRSYHIDYQCMQAQHVDFFERFEHDTSYVDHYGPNWGNMYDYCWYEHCASSDF